VRLAQERGVFPGEGLEQFEFVSAGRGAEQHAERE
jgi:hypothetical protein